MNEHVAGFYGADGQADLWAYQWRTPPGAELVCNPDDHFVIEVRRSNGTVLMVANVRGPLSELRVR